MFKALIKREILTSRKVLYTEAYTRNQYLFCKKDAFQNTGFSRLECQLKRKKIDSPSLERFSKFQPTNEWVNRVNLSSFEREKFFKFVLA